MFSKKATQIDKNLHCEFDASKCQIYGEDFVNFSGLLRKYELYHACQHLPIFTDTIFFIFVFCKNRYILAGQLLNFIV